MNYYNEWDPKIAAWLKELIKEGLVSDGEVDTRSIVDVSPGDVRGFVQCHFFAGIGGWSEALRLANWDSNRPVWTGSCPCQPFSCAGKRGGTSDVRHLWPEFFRLISERRPPVVFGEQVKGAIKHGWLDGISADLEKEGYAVGPAVLGAHSVGAPHIRQRLYWVAKSRSQPEGWMLCGSKEGHQENGEWSPSESGGSGSIGWMEYPEGHGREQRRAEPIRGSIVSRCGVGGLGDTDSKGLSECSERDSEQERRIESSRRTDISRSNAWSAYELIPCLDGKTRRFKPDAFPLAYEFPERVGLLRGIGNAIVPALAAAFIQAYLDTLS